MKALVIRPYCHPVVEELPDLKAMQECVGGYIQAIYPWPGVEAALVCDEEGLYHDADWNRYICDGVAIKGTFFICGLGAENFEDLPEDLLERFRKEFHEPEVFLRTQNGIAVMNIHGMKACMRC